MINRIAGNASVAKNVLALIYNLDYKNYELTGINFFLLIYNFS